MIVVDKRFDDLAGVVNQIDSKVEERVSLIKDRVPSSQLDAEKLKILNQVNDETLIEYVIPGVNKVMEKSLFQAVFGKDKHMIETYNYHNDFNVPIVLRLEDKIIDIDQDEGGAHTWEKMSESKSQILQLLDRFPSIKEGYENKVTQITEMLTQKKASGEVRAKADIMIQELKSRLLQEEEAKRIMSEIEKDTLAKTAGESEPVIQFKNDEFRKDIKIMVDKNRGKLNEQTPMEVKHELSVYILASNEKINGLLKKIGSQEIIVKVIKRLQSKILKSLDNPEFDYENMMIELNQEVDKIEAAQFADIGDGSIVLRESSALMSGQNFNFTLEEIMTDQRANIDFFEFQAMDPVFASSIDAEQSQANILVTPDIIYGVAPSVSGEFTYKVLLKWIPFKYQKDPQTLDSNITLVVVGDPNDSDAKFIKTIFYGCMSLSVFGFGFLIYRRYNKRQNEKFYEMYSYEDELREELKLDCSIGSSEKSDDIHVV